ncbi:DUF3822 family protein [Microbacter margulisiae]|uniref:DUF3822 family protein n=1 Tax=Microbacter margulisiae TaxID=1350067 RepID=A0A7W5H1J0_9PORP|nr:DUF3822 family protein [Microbacter margulisiae]MBB3186411.1 hypothetical protein [Microbacter margulisiae]
MHERYLPSKLQSDALHLYHFILKIDHVMWAWFIVERKTKLLVAGNQGTYNSFKEIEAELNQWDINGFGKSSLIIFSEDSLFVPRPFFNQDYRQDLFQFCNELKEDFVLEHVDLEYLDMVGLFLVPKKIYEFAHHFLPDIKYCHVSSTLLCAAYQLSKRSFQPVMVIGLYPEIMFVALADGGKILLLNHFKVITPEDLLYWIMRLFEQFELESSSALVHLSGNKTIITEKIFYLRTYLKKVSVLPFPSTIPVTSDVPEDLYHSFTDLVYYILCES